jgi:transposase
MNVSRLVPDELWEAIESLLPKEPPKPNGGRPRVSDRAALGGIVFALRTGCPWRLLPKELGCGSGTTCWRRLRDWQAAGVWQRLHERLLNWLGDDAAVDWSRASVDSLRACFKTLPGPQLPRPTGRESPLVMRGFPIRPYGPTTRRQVLQHALRGDPGGDRQKGGDEHGLIPLTVPEVRRLLAVLLVGQEQHPHRLHWSRWRRKRQAEARRSHYKRRLSRSVPNVPL